MFGRGRKSKRAPSTNEGAATYAGLRSRVLELDPKTVGIAPTPEAPRVYGVLMETGYDDYSVTLVSLADGTTSLYFSTGGGVIGCGEQEPVRVVSQAFVRAADEALELLQPSDGVEGPTAGRTIIRALTYDGPCLVDALEVEFGEGNHPASDLFYCGQDVITAIREHSSDGADTGFHE